MNTLGNSREDKQFLAKILIDAVPFTVRNLSPDRRQATWHITQLCRRRNTDIPTEHAQITKIWEINSGAPMVALADVGKLSIICEQQAFEIEAANREEKAIEALAAPSDIDPDCANRILHEAITGYY